MSQSKRIRCLAASHALVQVEKLSVVDDEQAQQSSADEYKLASYNIIRVRQHVLVQASSIHSWLLVAFTAPKLDAE